MKNIKKLLFVLVIVLGLTGCSFNSSKKEDNKEEPKKPVVDTEPIKVTTSLFNWVGSYINEEDGNSIEISVYANADDLSIDINIPGTDDATVEEDGTIHFTSEGGNSFTFDVDDVTDDTITVANEFLGLKGSISKSENGLDVNLVYGDAHESHAIKGYFKAQETVGGIKGYYTNENGVIAISPLADYVRLSIAVNGSYDEICEYVSDTEVNCESDFDDDYINITKTDKGIKVDSNKKALNGEYKEEK